MTHDYVFLLIAQQQQREVEEMARAAWKHSVPREKRSFGSIFKKKPGLQPCACSCPSEA